MWSNHCVLRTVNWNEELTRRSRGQKLHTNVETFIIAIVISSKLIFSNIWSETWAPWLAFDNTLYITHMVSPRLYKIWRNCTVQWCCSGNALIRFRWLSVFPHVGFKPHASFDSLPPHQPAFICLRLDFIHCWLDFYSSLIGFSVFSVFIQSQIS